MRAQWTVSTEASAMVLVHLTKGGAGTHYAGVNKGVFEFLVAAKQLSLQEGRILDIFE